MANLYIVATPIGNIEDITLRALKILKEADLILCEDTRKTKILLNHYKIQTPTESYHQHSKIRKVGKIKETLKQGKDIALVSDSGTPGISDPGSKLIQEVKNIASIIPIPGPSALTAIISISGLPTNKFLFLGFPPHKKGRNKFFKEIQDSKYSVIIYESPHRIEKTIKELKNIKSKEIIIGRELTKKFETIYRGEIDNIEIPKQEQKGEFTIAINK
ncbi:MAG: 16S rRNA (cytidine(1402)-2'-O)-methyltransferase [Candidatus Portnoybacteria bacterium]|nr:16S rRNA (cytidine(1402)-2'-O)-methyltransferase [Candidatus Portnoybacteria bacterium]